MHYIDWERFKKLAKHFKGGRYLDIGCFNSPMPFELKLDYKNSEIYALDHAPYLIEHLRKLYPEVKYRLGDINNLPFDNDFFDYIVAGELLEHLESPKEFISEVMRILKPGGIFALSTPKDETVLISKEHLWSFSTEDVINLLKNYGEIEIGFHEDTQKVILAYLKKDG